MYIIFEFFKHTFPRLRYSKSKKVLKHHAAIIISLFYEIFSINSTFSRKKFDFYQIISTVFKDYFLFKHLMIGTSGFGLKFLIQYSIVPAMLHFRNILMLKINSFLKNAFRYVQFCCFIWIHEDNKSVSRNFLPCNFFAFHDTMRCCL